MLRHARAVDVNIEPPKFSSAGSAVKMSGLTARMYDMVRNVVIPATISVRRLCFFESKPKSFLSIMLSLSLGYKYMMPQR